MESASTSGKEDQKSGSNRTVWRKRLDGTDRDSRERVYFFSCGMGQRGGGRAQLGKTACHLFGDEEEGKKDVLCIGLCLPALSEGGRFGRKITLRLDARNAGGAETL